jgi:hypothetical protein
MYKIELAMWINLKNKILHEDKEDPEESSRIKKQAKPNILFGNIYVNNRTIL